MALAVAMIDEIFIHEWIKYQEDLSKDGDEDLHWTEDHLMDLMLQGEYSELWDFIMKVYRKEPSKKVLAILAAGELEDILVAKGDEYIARVELLAANDQRFKNLLGGVWKNAMSDEVWQKVSDASNKEFFDS
ncbi:hypothetical protein D1AOALGA4SA_8043 [Olavius algarvensis Delta 1 endosymbiont]|nr:hypothetical protein D1AOALGA4SA_8043 [Olavius algarvensis Delta 1 endosymbiont]